jgi:hypothetical protein
VKGEPRDVIDFINNCFIKKQAVKVIKNDDNQIKKVKKDANDDVDNDVDDVDNDVDAKPPKNCPEGKVLNPKTGRCIKDKTGAAAAKSPKKCPEGKVLNPKTGRCILQKSRDDKHSF